MVIGRTEVVVANDAKMVGIWNILGFLFIAKRFMYMKTFKNNVSNTHFSTLFLTLTYLFDEINECATTLWGFNFQSVNPQWFKPIREWVIKRVLLTLFNI